MPYYEAIIGTDYEDEEHIPVAVAEAVWHLIPVMTQGPPIDIDIYGGDGEQQIGVGVTFECYHLIESIEDCGAESVEEVSIEP